MSIQRIVLNETSYFGAGSRSVLAAEIAARGFRKALVVTDKDLTKFGVAAKVTAVLDQAKVPYEVFDDVKQNPTIANVKNITGQIASGQGTAGKLIYDDALYNSAMNTVTNIQGSVTDARQMISGAKEMVDNVRAGQGTLGKLLTDDKLYNATTGSMTNLNQIMYKINHGQGTVGKLVNDEDFLKNAKVSLQKLDKAADGLEDQGPLSVLGIMANNLF